MRRLRDLQSIAGQQAWLYYQKWNKSYNRLVPHPEVFIKSKFFVPFLRFAKFAKKVHIPDMDSYIWLMKEKQMSPMIWDKDQVYGLYLEFLDRRAKPADRVKTTLKTLFDVAEAADCDVSEFFDIVTGTEVIQLLRQRRLSPWILLRSGKFRTFLSNRVSSEEIKIIQATIKPSFWKEKFEKNKDIVKMMDSYITELGL